ncbi:MULTISPECIES: PP2C family protein-serine/threonine phosphatase [Mycolicibacterium]|uniref:PP2C family protein-serine/threonine phosphatase n=1 Tax=Mycolicibacterium monacense TaxID=85693 RepID=UPI0007EA2270|nr:SpoIIE family protein phosphatase [Mycolicibacterium monacense]OBB72018.1 histidine kinase [Mycolicibacterium monacense]
MNSAEGAAPAPECSVEDLYEHAPCGQLATAPDRRIISVNETLVRWLGRSRDELIGTPFTDLLTVGSRIHFETHFAPLLHLTGELQGVAVDLIAAGSARLPALIAANVKTDTGGAPATIRFVLQDASDRRAYERELLAERERAEQERTRATALARTLKRSLLPPALSPLAGLEACAHLHAASHDEVGGDFYDLFALAPGRSAFFLGDSCGKGISAATVASLTRYTLRAAAVFDDDPVAVLHNLDTVLINEFGADRSHFCTVIYGVLARHNGGFDVHLASGGHPPALLLRADGGVHKITTEGGQAVGIFTNARFASARVHLGAGDTLVLYTDGVTEARIGSGAERFDDHDALMELARAHAPTTATAIVETLRNLLADLGDGVEDDAAVLALGVPR